VITALLTLVIYYLVLQTRSVSTEDPDGRQVRRQAQILDVRHRSSRRAGWSTSADVPKRFATEVAAAREEEDRQATVRQDRPAADGTVVAELPQWLGERELDLAVTTLANYRHAIKTYVIPFLGGRQLYTLDKRAIHDLYRHLVARGGRNGKPLSAETVRHVHRTV
jgi:hypothetical protein